MRGDDPKAASVWSYIPIEAGVPADHPLRPIREMTDRALRELDPVFRRLYAKTGRPSIPPERLASKDRPTAPRAWVDGAGVTVLVLLDASGHVSYVELYQVPPPRSSA